MSSKIFKGKVFKQNINNLWLVLALSIFCLPTLALGAGLDLSAKVEQLRVNSENSQSNLAQYRKNLEVVNANLVEINKALNNLKAQKAELNQSAANAEKGKSVLQEAEQQLIGLRNEEQNKLNQESRQADQLAAASQRLQDNRKQREANIAAYNQKLAELKKERESWSGQRGSVNELNQAIEAKEKEALNERKKWQEKQKSYQAEVDKWTRQATLSERSYRQFQNIK